MVKPGGAKSSSWPVNLPAAQPLIKPLILKYNVDLQMNLQICFM